MKLAIHVVSVSRRRYVLHTASRPVQWLCRSLPSALDDLHAECAQILRPHRLSGVVPADRYDMPGSLHRSDRVLISAPGWRAAVAGSARDRSSGFEIGFELAPDFHLHFHRMTFVPFAVSNNGDMVTLLHGEILDPEGCGFHTPNTGT